METQINPAPSGASEFSETQLNSSSGGSEFGSGFDEMEETIQGLASDGMD